MNNLDYNFLLETASFNHKGCRVRSVCKLSLPIVFVGRGVGEQNPVGHQFSMTSVKHMQMVYN